MPFKLSECAIAIVHRPVPSRYVQHHIQPQVCGGKSVPDNMVTLCDNCHYTVHRIMFSMKYGGTEDPKKVGNRRQRKIAADGYARCVAAGTVSMIPNEG